jgi:uncharacterized protein (DUF1330 family)
MRETAHTDRKEMGKPDPPSGSGPVIVMSAYLVSEFSVADEADARRYAKLASRSVARHGGRYVVQGAAPHVPEGDWPGGQRVSIIEFPSMNRLLDWYRSSEYAQALAVRTPGMKRRLIFVEGPDQSVS